MQNEIIHYYFIKAVSNKQQMADMKTVKNKNIYLFKCHKQIKASQHYHAQYEKYVFILEISDNYISLWINKG